MAARAGAALAVIGLVASTGTMAQNAKLSDLATLAGHWRRDISRFSAPKVLAAGYGTAAVESAGYSLAASPDGRAALLGVTMPASPAAPRA